MKAFLVLHLPNLPQPIVFEAQSAEMSVLLDHCHAWSDSHIVLSWLRSSELVGNSLVDNYISHIQETLPYNLWRYV